MTTHYNSGELRLESSSEYVHIHVHGPVRSPLTTTSSPLYTDGDIYNHFMPFWMNFNRDYLMWAIITSLLNFNRPVTYRDKHCKHTCLHVLIMGLLFVLYNLRQIGSRSWINPLLLYRSVKQKRLTVTGLAGYLMTINRLKRYCSFECREEYL